MNPIIRRDHYLQKLIDRKENGLIKVITGIRRCGIYKHLELVENLSVPDVYIYRSAGCRRLLAGNPGRNEEI